MGPIVQQAPSAILGAASAISGPTEADAAAKSTEAEPAKPRAPETRKSKATDNEAPPGSRHQCHRRQSGHGLDHNNNNSVKTPLPVAKTPKYGATEQQQQPQQQQFVCSLDSRHPPKGGGGGQGDGNESGLLAGEAERKGWLERTADRIPGLGVMLSLCASIFLGSAGMLVKVTQSVHGIQVAVLRAVIQLVVYGLVIQLRGLAWVPREGERMAVMGRASLGAASITCSYFALKLIPLGDATVIRFSLPIWTLIVSYLVLNESCSLLKVAAVVVSISGVVLIAKPDMCVYVLHLLWHSLGLESDQELAVHADDYESVLIKTLPTSVSGDELQQESGHISQQLQGSLLALSSSVCLAMSLIALRLCQKTPTEITIVWLSIFSIVIGTVTLVCINEWRLPNNWTDVIYILLNGICGAIGQWFITNALKIEQSGVISLARTFDIEVAFLYSAFLLREQIRVTSLVGSLLVSFGVVAVVVPKWLSSKSKSGDEGDTGAASATDANKESNGIGAGENEKSVAVAVGPARQTRSVC